MPDQPVAEIAGTGCNWDGGRQPAGDPQGGLSGQQIAKKGGGGSCWNARFALLVMGRKLAPSALVLVMV
jgi:hypothetical protein